MKLLTLAFLFPLFTYSQEIEFDWDYLSKKEVEKTIQKWDYVGYGMIATAAFTNAVREVYHANPEIFELKYGADQYGFWGSKSWKRKHNGVQASVSDFWHVSNTVRLGAVVGGTTILTISSATKKYTMWQHIQRVGLGMLVYSTTSYITYETFKRYKK